ncbi:MAG: hypothetical protein ABFS41_17955 [Myxococcota bacterium]
MHESARKQFRLDRRLLGRRGWTEPDELERELAALPDVAEKAELVDAPGAARRDEDSPQGS